MATVTLIEAAERIGRTPLEIAITCALRGFPCEGGVLDEGVLPILGPTVVSDPVAVEEEDHDAIAEVNADETEEERRLRVVRRVLERLVRTGKWMPARTERRSTGRGLGGPDVGLALRAVDVMVDCGLMRSEQHGGKEQKVGLNGERRQEIGDIVDGRPVADDILRAWITGG
jgi:hypothetical protein